jgi:hypothetical protein
MLRGGHYFLDIYSDDRELYPSLTIKLALKTSMF